MYIRSLVMTLRNRTAVTIASTPETSAQHATFRCRSCLTNPPIEDRYGAFINLPPEELLQTPLEHRTR